MLHVPSIIENLLSVTKFTKDNIVLVEFHDDYVYVKDKSSGQRLIQRKLRTGLYAFDVAINKPIQACEYIQQ